MAARHRIFAMPLASVYPHYLAKAEKKGRTKAELDALICWLTGHNQKSLERQLKNQVDLETFFAQAPALNPSRCLIKGTVCGVRVEDIEEPTMREIRYLDKLVDELAKGRSMEKIMRVAAETPLQKAIERELVSRSRRLAGTDGGRQLARVEPAPDAQRLPPGGSRFNPRTRRS